MNLNSLQWRIAFPYTILIFVAISIVVVFASSMIGKEDIDLIVVTVLIFGTFVSLLSVVLSFYIARRTDRAIRILADGASRIQSGELSHRVRTTFNNETSDLALAFNNMADTISVTVETLSSERDMLSAVLNTMADGVISMDREGEITVFNETAGNLLNVVPSEAVGLRIAEVVRDFEILQLAHRCSDTGSLMMSEVEVPEVRKSLSVTATPLGPGGERGVLLTIHDLTDVRQVETSRKEFVSNVSHELRSPITSIRAMVEVLEDGALNDSKTALDFIGRINGEIERMTSMVNELLELSRIESGQEVVDIRPVNLHKVVKDTIFNLNQQNQGNIPNIELAFDNGIIVLGQENKLVQILQNLLQNASKFTPLSGEIEVNANPVENGHIMVSVSDSGSGIPAEHIAHVFERFYKVDRSRRDKGTGLGLSIVKHLVQAHGGEVSVESVEGEGSTFYFTIPNA